MLPAAMLPAAVVLSILDGSDAGMLEAAGADPIDTGPSDMVARCAPRLAAALLRNCAFKACCSSVGAGLMDATSGTPLLELNKGINLVVSPAAHATHFS